MNFVTEESSASLSVIQFGLRHSVSVRLIIPFLIQRLETEHKKRADISYDNSMGKARK